MIIKTTTPDQFRDAMNRLKTNGYTQVTSSVLPNWIAGNNYIEIDTGIAVFALCSEEKAKRVGYKTYPEWTHLY